MNPSPSPRPWALLSAAVALLAAGCAAPTSPPPASAVANPGPPYAGLVSLDYSGSQAARDALQQAIVAAGKDRANLASIEASLLEMLARPYATFAGQQVICETLGALYASDPAREVAVAPALARMLSDDTRVDLARLALERAPGAAADEAFVSRVSRSSGRLRIALIQSIGNRRIAAAVPVLASLLREPDAAAAAEYSLAQIGSPAALAALDAAPDPSSPSLAEARIKCARRLPATEALAVYRDVRSNSALPAPVRVSAFLAILELEPETTGEQVAAVLGGGDLPLKQAVLNSLARLPAAAVIPAVATGVKSWDRVTQIAAIAALGRIGDPAALPAVVEAARSADLDLRRTAISSLGAIPGNPEVAMLLADAAGEPGEIGKAARQSLSQIRGTGVDETILAGAARVGDPRRLVFLEELALRNAPGASEVLMKAHGEDSVAVRCAVLDGLALVAPASDEPILIGWMVSATDPTEKTHASRAVVGAAERNPDDQARLKLVADLIDGAPLALQKRFLSILSRTGGKAGADYVAAFALRKDGELALAAVAALGEWPHRVGLGPLAGIAEKAQNEPLRQAAVDNAIQILLPSRGWLNKEQKAVVARLRAVTKDAALTRRLDELDTFAPS